MKIQLEEKQEKEDDEKLQTNTFQKVAQEDKDYSQMVVELKKYLEAQ